METYKLLLCSFITGKNRVGVKYVDEDFKSPMGALAYLQAHTSIGYGNLQSATCYRYVDEERKERQWIFTVN